MELKIQSTNKSVRLISVIFFAVFVAIVGSILLFLSNQASIIPPDTKITTAEVANIEVIEVSSGVKEYKDYVTYNVDNIEYENILMNGYDSSLKVGDPVAISYPIDKPGEPSYFPQVSFESLKYYGITLLGAAGWIIITGTCITILRKI